MLILPFETIPKPGTHATLPDLAPDITAVLASEAAAIIQMAADTRHINAVVGKRVAQFAFDRSIQTTFMRPPGHMIPGYPKREQFPVTARVYDELVAAAGRCRGFLGAGLIRVNEVEPGNVYPSHIDDVSGVSLTVTAAGRGLRHYKVGKEWLDVPDHPGSLALHTNGNHAIMRQKHGASVPVEADCPRVSVVFTTLRRDFRDLRRRDLPAL